MKIFLRKYGEIWMFPFFFFFNELKIIHDHEGKENTKINSSKLLSKLEIQMKGFIQIREFTTGRACETCNNLVFSYWRYCSIRVTTLIYFLFFSKRPASALSDWAVNVAACSSSPSSLSSSAFKSLCRKSCNYPTHRPRNRATCLLI